MRTVSTASSGVRARAAASESSPAGRVTPTGRRTGVRDASYRAMVKIRSPHLYGALRDFCLAAFARLGPDVEQAGEIPFVVEERSGLYEYRPLLRDHVVARAASLAELEDARIAVVELEREPAAAVFGEGGALFPAILVPLLIATAEACGGFDWEDGAFNRTYAELEHSLYGA